MSAAARRGRCPDRAATPCPSGSNAGGHARRPADGAALRASDAFRDHPAGKPGPGIGGVEIARAARPIDGHRRVVHHGGIAGPDLDAAHIARRRRAAPGGRDARNDVAFARRAICVRRRQLRRRGRACRAASPQSTSAVAADRRGRLPSRAPPFTHCSMTPISASVRRRSLANFAVARLGQPRRHGPCPDGVGRSACAAARRRGTRRG